MVVSREDIAGPLRDRIESGQYPEGAKVPSARELAGAHAASRTTANEALHQLAREGLIALRDKSRAVVLTRDGATRTAEQRVTEAKAELKNARDEVRATRTDLADLEQRLSSALGKLES